MLYEVITEMPSILFFLGILMAVAALESLGMLYDFAGVLEANVPNLGTEHHSTKISDLVVLLLGAGSAVIDNVPLVTASIGMFQIGTDEPAWHFIAYAAGTGGSMLIIGRITSYNVCYTKLLRISAFTSSSSIKRSLFKSIKNIFPGSKRPLRSIFSSSMGKASYNFV